MLIFLPNIPASTRKHELMEYISNIISADAINPFRKTGDLTKIDLMVLNDTTLKLTEYHALIDIEPDSAALQVIKQIRKKPFKGKRIIARHFFPRDWHNDRRFLLQEKLKNAHARRINDRRRYHIKAGDDESVSVTGYEDLSHKI